MNRRRSLSNCETLSNRAENHGSKSGGVFPFLLRVEGYLSSVFSIVDRTEACEISDEGHTAGT
jgi:hypothetical protein